MCNFIFYLLIVTQYILKFMKGNIESPCIMEINRFLMLLFIYLSQNNMRLLQWTSGPGLLQSCTARTLIPFEVWMYARVFLC
jgi:hypothetical protein